MEMENYLDYNNNGQTTFKQNNKLNALKLNNNGEYKKALDIINLVNQKDFESYNIKGLILTNLSEFDEAIKCFDIALSLSNRDEIKANKANALYNLAKLAFFPEMNYFKAIKLIDKALMILPEIEDASEFYFLKAEILEAQNDLVESHKCYLKAHKQFDKVKELENQIEYLSNTEDNLFIITGTSYYGNFKAEKGLIVDLFPEKDNEYDSDAIAVIFGGKTVGYVANNEYTLIDDVKSASDIKNLINDENKGEILFIFLGEYIVTKLID